MSDSQGYYAEDPISLQEILSGSWKIPWMQSQGEKTKRGMRGDAESWALTRIRMGRGLVMSLTH